MSEPSPDAQSTKWIAYELHDGLLQWLQGALMHLSNCESAADSSPQLQTAIHCLRQAIGEGRALVSYLEGNGDSSRGSLADGIRSLATALEPMRTNHHQPLPINVASDDLPELPQPQVWSILRVIQQAVFNALQHAGSIPIRIEARHDAQNLVIRIIDQGQGFVASNTPANDRFGMTSMNQRAIALGGRVDVSSIPGAGTTVQLTVPLPEHPVDGARSSSPGSFLS